jgi:hypothetical protein
VRSNEIVRLAPGLVARVSGLVDEVRDTRVHFEREVAIARHLRGGPVVEPYEPAGPHTCDGRVITLWHEVPPGPPAEGAAIGEALRDCHARLRTFDGELPPLRALLHEAAALSPELAPRLARCTDALDELPAQPVHGDAGLGNVLPGPRWNDWEDCCRGPVLWDMASLVARPRVMETDVERAEAALAAYGDAPGRDELLDVAVEARVLQATAWSALSVARGIADPAHLVKRRAWLGI